jgi:hypothetical protein
MLVTIREFGREQLAGVDEQRALRSRHAHYYATLVDEAAVASGSPAARGWGRHLEHESSRCGRPCATSSTPTTWWTACG